MDNFKPGDLVRHKAGFTDMVIEEIHRTMRGFEPYAMCSWMDRDHQKHQDCFNLTALVHVKPDARPAHLDRRR